MKFTILCAVHLASVLRLLNAFPTSNLQASEQSFYLTNSQWTSSPIQPKLQFTINSNSGATSLKVLAKPQKSLWVLQTTEQNSPQIIVKLGRNLSAETYEYELVWFDVSIIDEICFTFNDTKQPNIKWYPLFFDITSSWPLKAEYTANGQPAKSSSIPALTHFTSELSPLVETAFLTTAGFAVVLDDLKYWNIEKRNEAGTLCFSINLSKLKPPEEVDHFDRLKRIKLTIVTSTNIRQLHQHLIQYGYFKRPGRLPDRRLFEPIWAHALADLLGEKHVGDNSGEATFNKMLTKFEATGFYERGQIIDLELGWERESGNFQVDQKNFNAHFPLSLNAGLVVAPTIGPHFRQHSTWSSDHHQQKGYYDLSNQVIVNELAAKFAALQLNNNITFYKLKDSTFSTDSVLDPITQKYPNFLVTQFTRAITSLTAGHTYLTAYKSQADANFLRLEVVLERESGEAGGLQSALTQALTASMAGYAFTVPQLWPYFSSNEKPSKLFVLRWMAATALLPGLYISIPFWLYEPALLKSIRESLHLRRDLTPQILSLANEWIATGKPIVRPMWYAEPYDSQTYSIWDQYMLGENILVAPLINLTQTSKRRAVYFPSGRWISLCSRTEHRGTAFEEHVEIGQPMVPIFVRAQVLEQFDNVHCSLWEDV